MEQFFWAQCTYVIQKNMKTHKHLGGLSHKNAKGNFTNIIFKGINLAQYIKAITRQNIPCIYL